MECLVTLGAVVVIFLAIYFQMRLSALEKKSREIDALKAEIGSLSQLLGLEADETDGTDGTDRADETATESAALPLAPPPQPTAPIPSPAAPTPHTAAPVAAPVPAAVASVPAPTAHVPDSPLWRWFMGSHMVVRVGIVILFTGVAFLLKYAADQGWLSIELRLASAGALGVALVYTGWRLRATRRIYALTLQGGGLGIAYLTTFAAFRIYELLPAPLAFALLVAIGVTCGVLAVLNDAKALALPAIVGGFAAPLLATTGEGSHVTLFSYFTLLNAAILLIAWYKSWRELNLAGFLFTFVLASWWGGAYYQPEFFATVEPFLLLFFAFYLAIGLLFARRQPPRLVGLVDGPLVFGTPAIVMVWQALLVRDIDYGLAWSAAGIGLLYLLLFGVLGRASTNYGNLRHSYLAIGTVLVTLAVPFAVDARLTSAIWALAGVGMLWMGLRQSWRFHVLWGGLVQMGAAAFFANLQLALLRNGRDTDLNDWLGLLDSTVVGGVLIAVAALVTGYLTLKAVRRGDYLVVANDLWFVTWGATLWGLAWWYGTGIYAVTRYFMDSTFTDGSGDFMPLAFLFVLTAITGEWLGRRFQWLAIRLTSLLLWAAISLFALIQNAFGDPFLRGWGWLVWPAAVVVHYWMLHRLEHPDLTRTSGGADRAMRWAGGVNVLVRTYHAIGLWLITMLAMLDLNMRDLTWHNNAWWDTLPVLAVPVVLTLLVSLFGKRLPWPTGSHYIHYMTVGLAPLLLSVVAMSVFNNLSSNGNSTPFPYLPLLNPVSVAHIIVLATLAIWISLLQQELADPAALRPAWLVGASLFFLWFNADIARIVHHFWDVPYEFNALLRSSMLQAIYSIIWTLLAMGLMFTGTRLARRPLWLVGAALLALTVIKLLVLDLAAADTLARIVSFIVVGLLMLLIGYLSPIPPVIAREETASP